MADSVASLVIQRLLASDALLEEPDSLFAAGAAVIIVSSELPELMNMCHRIVVMSGGRLQDELEAEEFDERRILAAAFAARGICYCAPSNP